MTGAGFIPTDEAEIARGWEVMRKTPVQKLLHNELLRRIEEARSKLETAKPDAVSELQQVIRSRREMLAFIHSKDTTSPY